MSLLLELSEITVKLGLFKAIVNQCLPVAPELLGSARKSDGCGKDLLCPRSMEFHHPWAQVCPCGDLQGSNKIVVFCFSKVTETSGTFLPHMWFCTRISVS